MTAFLPSSGPAWGLVLAACMLAPAPGQAAPTAEPPPTSAPPVAAPPKRPPPRPVAPMQEPAPSEDEDDSAAQDEPASEDDPGTEDTDTPDASDADQSPDPDPAGDGSEPTQEPPLDEAVLGPMVVDTVLPSGVRVIAAQDDTLPVAAVVLAVETGSEDDPDHLPGLTHALAYHLLQGNREYAPAAITQLAHDSGGVTSMATGPAQIRFESLVPVSMLDEILRAESQRLRAPTVREHLWSDSLSWARRDPHREWSVPRAALAVAHGSTGLLHDGRQVSKELGELDTRQVGALLADRMGYDRATLVVVAPQTPLATLATLEALFADLPSRPRDVPTREILPFTGTQPRPVLVEDADGQVFAWPIEAGPQAVAWARVWCRAINRQRRAPDEPKRARLRCKLDEDPRRPLLVVRALGSETPVELVRNRLERLATTEASHLDRERQIVLDDLELDLRTPLFLARTLATAPARAPDDARARRGVHELTGLASLRRPDGRSPSLQTWLVPARAVRLVGQQEGG